MTLSPLLLSPLFETFDQSTLAVLGLVAFLAGVGTAAIGPGNVFVAVTLTLLPVSPATVAGTVSANNVAAGTLGAGAYARSGELRSTRGKRLTAVLCVGSVAGALLGQWLNGFVSKGEFMLLLGLLLVSVGTLTWYRTGNDLSLLSVSVSTPRGVAAVASLAVAVGVSGGLLGVGGPLLAVPLLVALDVPLLLALAAAQVQSVFVATPAALAYLAEGSLSPALVAWILVPNLLGVLTGWTVAHRVEADRLKVALATTLTLFGAYLAMTA